METIFVVGKLLGTEVFNFQKITSASMPLFILSHKDHNSERENAAPFKDRLANVPVKESLKQSRNLWLFSYPF